MFGLQVYVEIGRGERAWLDVRPRDGLPYRYETRAEAERMARLCYDSDSTIVRVVELVPVKTKPMEKKR